MAERKTGDLVATWSFVLLGFAIMGYAAIELLSGGGTGWFVALYTAGTMIFNRIDRDVYRQRLNSALEIIEQSDIEVERHEYTEYRVIEEE